MGNKAGIFDYISGPSDLEFFKDLWSIPEFEESPEDSPDRRMTKLRQKLSYLSLIKETMDQPGFRTLEETLYRKVKAIDNTIWSPILSEDDSQVRRLTIERTGIVAVFEALHAVRDQIEAVRSQIDELERGDDPREAIEELQNG